MTEPQGDDLGQHRLVDDAVIARIVAAADLRPGESVLDAGAGAGALTMPIAAAVGPNGRVLAVEIDASTAAHLRAAAPAHVEVVSQDLLLLGLSDPVDAVVANPPFRIAAPLIERLLTAGVARLVLVVPRELADRLVARPGDDRYGRLTVRVALLADVEDLGSIPRRAFAPPPGVACALVRLRRRADATAPLADALAAVLDLAFAAPQRKAKHALAALAPRWRVDSAALTRLLDEQGWSDTVVSRLPPQAFAAVAHLLGPAAIS